MNIVIIGQGAIGLLWYFKLSQQVKNKVTLQCSKTFKSVTTQMSFTDTSQLKHQKMIIPATTNDLGKADLIIYCLKAYAIENAQQQYHSLINKKAVVIYAHNGIISNSELLSKTASHQAEIVMLLTHGSLKTDDFQITHTGQGHCDIGLIDGEINDISKNNLVNVLNTALPTVIWQNNIKEKQWLKLAVNSVINPLTALHNCDNGAITSMVFKKEIQEILQEVIKIAAKHSVAFFLENLTKQVLTVANNTALNSSSMRSDILANRQTEIDHINGFIHLEGIKHNIATPKNTFMWQQIKKLETINGD